MLKMSECAMSIGMRKFLAAVPRNRIAADSTRAGRRRGRRRKIKSQICHRPESVHRSGSMYINWLKAASTNCFSQVLFQEMPPCHS